MISESNVHMTFWVESCYTKTHTLTFINKKTRGLEPRAFSTAIINTNHQRKNSQ